MQWLVFLPHLVHGKLAVQPVELVGLRVREAQGVGAPVGAIPGRQATHNQVDDVLGGYIDI